MRVTCVRLTFVTAAAFTLSGCGTMQSIFGPHSARMPEYRVVAAANPEAAIAQATDEGRRHLDRGETGLAIEAFRRALSAGPPTAPALNGMGVAFARLGRYELAHRYFQQAAVLDPLDQRYAANLSRLNRSPAFAMRHDGDIVAAALADAGRSKLEQPAPALAMPEPRSGSLTRISSREYRIRTAQPMPAPLIKSAAASDPQFKPMVRIEFSKPGSFREEEPGRVTLSNPHLGKTAALDPRFKPIVRFDLEQPASDGQDGRDD
jgi:hypothetical protein